MEKKEYAIGEVFEYEGKKCKCIEDTSELGDECIGCIFSGGCSKIETPLCTGDDREDGTAVKFIPIEEDSSVDHPSHYTSHPSGVECIDITKHHNFCIGNVIKYCWRAGLKEVSPKLEDLKKARKYLEFEIKRIEDEENKIGR